MLPDCSASFGVDGPASRPTVRFGVASPDGLEAASDLGAHEVVDGGVIRPLIDSVFPLCDARAAFERSLARGKRGKVVLRVSGV